MRLNMYDAFDLMAEDSVELLMEYEGTDRLSDAAQQYSPEAVIQAVLEGDIANGADSKIRDKKRALKKSWKVYFLAAVLVVTAFSSVSFAVRKRDVRRSYGAELVNETNQDLVGKELSAETSKIYDEKGNWVNEDEYKAIYGEPYSDLFDWKTCPLIREVDSDNCIPRTIDEFAVQEKEGTYVTPEVIFSNGAMVIFVKEDGSGWHLKKGERLLFEAEEYPSEIGWGKGQRVIYQYISNGTLIRDTSLEKEKVSLEQSYEVTAEETGEYYICLTGGSSDPITMKKGTITVR